MKSCPNHPEKLAWARGLCKACYHKWLVTNNPDYAKNQRDNSRNYAKKYPDKIKAIRVRRNLLEKTEEKYIKQRRNKTLKKYGITEDDYQRVLQEQEGVCFICGKPNHSGKKLHVDHNHTTNVVRSLLCAQCNWFVGKIDRNVQTLNKLIHYESTWLESLNVTIQENQSTL